jgi:hypothetical protein
MNSPIRFQIFDYIFRNRSLQKKNNNNKSNEEKPSLLVVSSVSVF